MLLFRNTHARFLQLLQHTHATSVHVCPDKKRSHFLNHSSLNNCHLSNFLTEMADFQIRSSQLCHLNGQEEKHNVLYPDSLVHAISLQNEHSMEHPLRKAIQGIPDPHLCYIWLWAQPWDFNMGCGTASSCPKTLQLTFPAPTGPTTANNSPGLTVKERSFRVGVSDACKQKFTKKCPFQ